MGKSSDAQKRASMNYYYAHKEEILEKRKKAYKEDPETFAIRNKNNKKRNHDPFRIAVTTLLDPKTIEKLDEKAENLGITRSACMRKAVLKFINEK